MELQKKKFSFSVKLSKNFQSVEITESFEMNMTEKEVNAFEVTKKRFMEKIKKQVKEQLESICK